MRFVLVFYFENLALKIMKLILEIGFCVRDAKLFNFVWLNCF